MNPGALKDPAKETLLNISNLGDSGAFLVNGGLRCLVAHLQLYRETDGNNHRDTSTTEIDV